jgi:hypothetical protein
VRAKDVADRSMDSGDDRARPTSRTAPENRREDVMDLVPRSAKRNPMGRKHALLLFPEIDV